MSNEKKERTEYGRFVFLNNEFEDRWNKAPESVKSEVCYILKQIIRENQSKVYDELIMKERSRLRSQAVEPSQHSSDKLKK